MMVKNALLFLMLGAPTMASSIPDTMLNSIWTFSQARLKATMAALGNSTSQYPRSAPQTGGKWGLVGSGDWTSGFYPGCLWLAYEKSGDTAFRNAAQRWTAALESQKNNTGTHDVGFMIFCSYGNGYRLLKTSSYLPIIQTAAQSLSTRYKALAGIIDSWDFAPYNTGWEEIIDNMMNLELLFWVAANGGSANYRTMAQSHAEKAMANHFRPDSSTFHVVRYSSTTGAMTSQETRQGYSNSSCWARGQAWAVYGFTMAYRYTKDARFLATAKKAAGYYISHLPVDRVPFWDFNAPGIPADTVPRDASSSAIVASGLLELCMFTGAPDSARYLDTAVSLIKGLWTSKYRGLTTQASILNHSTGSRTEGHDVDMGIIYADYYFLEALLRYEKLGGATAIARNSATPQKEPLHHTIHDAPDRCNLLGRSIRSFSGPPAPGTLILQPEKSRSAQDGTRKAVMGFDN
jgi:unsaturated chondroitin disaccharide hydrolase